MGLKYELEAAPEEAVKGFYKETNGKWILDVEGAVPATKLSETETKLNEFRTNNITLKQQLETATKTSLKDKKPDEINVEQILEQHVAELKGNYEGQVKKVSEENAALKGHLERVVLSDSVKTAATEYGVLPSALPDVLNRAKDMFIVADGVAVPKDKKLDKEGKPYSIAAWITSLNETAPHLFAQSRGSGSQKPVKGMPQLGELTAAERISKGIKNLTK